MDEILNKRLNWYNKTFVQFELLKAMKNREVVFMDRKDNWKCIRGIRISTIHFLNVCFDNFKFFKKDYNIYVSVAKYKSIPNFTADLVDRSKYTNEWFKNEAKKSILNYDLLLDFDAGNPESYLYMKRGLEKLIKIFNHYNICYRFFPSGRNFQMIIDGKILPDYNITKIKLFTEKLKLQFNLNYLDLKGIGNSEKIRKCEYSLVFDKVVLPIPWLDEFDYKNVDCNKVLNTEKIMNRGLKKINDYGIDMNKENFKLFLELNHMSW